MYFVQFYANGYVKSLCENLYNKDLSYYNLIFLITIMKIELLFYDMLSKLVKFWFTEHAVWIEHSALKIIIIDKAKY